MTTKAAMTQDGITSMISGVSGAVDADQLPQDQIAWASNGSLKNGRYRVRPALTERLRLPFGHVQGAGVFESEQGEIMVMIDGFLYSISLVGGEFIYQRVDAEFQGNPNARQAWFEMTPGYLVIQNGRDRPIIYDGATARRAEDDEVPTGKMMAYGNGRLWVVLGDRTLVAGDIVGTSEDSHLKFTETDYLFGGGTFSMPEVVTGMSFLPSNDGTTGYGALLIGGRYWMNAIRADITSRDAWQTTQGFITTLFRSIGFLSHDSIVEVNQDLYFRDGAGGVRSLRQAVSDVTDPGLTPLSREMAKLFDYESDDLMWGARGVYFDNRLLMSASPYLKLGGYVGYKDIATLSFAPLETMRGKAPPAWEGEWEGVYHTQMIKGRFLGVERAFIIAQHEDGSNRLWEIEREEGNTYQDRYIDVGNALAKSDIQGYIDTRKFDFGSSFQKKRLERLDIWTSDIRGATTIKVYSRLDNDPEWSLWDTFTAGADMDYDGSVDLTSFVPLRPRSQNSRKTLTPDRYFTGAVTFFTVQIRLVITGRCQIDRVLVHATPVEGERYSADNDLTIAQNPISYLDMEYKVPYTPVTYESFVDELGDEYADEEDDIYEGASA